MIHGTTRDANSLSPVPSAARPSRTARHMLLSFMDRTRLPSRDREFPTLAPGCHALCDAATGEFHKRGHSRTAVDGRLKVGA
jgi:hypothetical protein